MAAHGSIGFTPPWQERRQRINDKQIEMIRFAKFNGTIDQHLPLTGGWPTISALPCWTVRPRNGVPFSKCCNKPVNNVVLPVFHKLVNSVTSPGIK